MEVPFGRIGLRWRATRAPGGQVDGRAERHNELLRPFCFGGVQYRIILPEPVESDKLRGCGGWPPRVLAGFTSLRSWYWLCAATDGRVVVWQVYEAVWVGLVEPVVLGVVLAACRIQADGHGRAGEWFHLAIVGP